MSKSDFFQNKMFQNVNFPRRCSNFHFFLNNLLPTKKILWESLAVFQNWTFFFSKNVHFQNVLFSPHKKNKSVRKYYKTFIK